MSPLLRLTGLSNLSRGSSEALRWWLKHETKMKGYQNMALYEHVFMARQDASTAQVEALVEQFKAVITAGGGKVGKV